MQTITEKNFKTIIKDGPVLVDFWAPWCGPCVAMEPILDQYDGMPVAKLNIDDYPEVAGQYNVMSIPTMKVFKDGEVLHTLVGSRPLAALTDELEEFTGTA